MTLGELALRAAMVAHAAVVIIPTRAIAGPRLDLLAREAYAGGVALGLHPREFALLWRLLDSPGEVADKRGLLSDVWRQRHMPETNSIAIHASRQRAKLALAGHANMLRTAPGGGYFVAARPESAPSMSMAAAAMG